MLLALEVDRRTPLRPGVARGILLRVDALVLVLPILPPGTEGKARNFRFYEGTGEYLRARKLGSITSMGA